jgi:acyl-CoA dehydrogenase
MGREEGRTALALADLMDRTVAELEKSKDGNVRGIAPALREAVRQVRDTVKWVAATYPSNPAAVGAGSVYVLKLMGIAAGGWMLARSAEVAARDLAAGQGDPEYLRGKILTARFFADHMMMAQAPALATAATRGAESVLAVAEAML